MMWELIILLLIYLLSGLAALTVAGWVMVSGQFFDIDGLFLALVCLSLAAVFLGAFALSVRKGEFSQVLSKVRGRKKAAPEPAESAAPAQSERQPAKSVPSGPA